LFIFRSRRATAIKVLAYDSCEQSDYVELIQETPVCR